MLMRVRAACRGVREAAAYAAKQVRRALFRYAADVADADAAYAMLTRFLRYAFAFFAYCQGDTMLDCHMAVYDATPFFAPRYALAVTLFIIELLFFVIISMLITMPAPSCRC